MLFYIVNQDLESELLPPLLEKLLTAPIHLNLNDLSQSQAQSMYPRFIGHLFHRLSLFIVDGLFYWLRDQIFIRCSHYSSLLPQVNYLSGVILHLPPGTASCTTVSVIGYPLLLFVLSSATFPSSPLFLGSNH